MKISITVLLSCLTIICCVQNAKPIFELKTQDNIILLQKRILGEDDKVTLKTLSIFSKIITKISNFKTFKTIILKEPDFCVTSSVLLDDWDYHFGTTFNSQNNFLVCSISPSGTCDDDNVMQIAIINYGSSTLAKKECNKVYSFFDNDGSLEPFLGFVTCYEEDGVLVFVEFLFQPHKELLDLFDNVTHYSHK